MSEDGIKLTTDVDETDLRVVARVRGEVIRRRVGGYFIVYGLIMLVNISPGDDSSSGTRTTLG